MEAEAKLGDGPRHLPHEHNQSHGVVGSPKMPTQLPIPLHAQSQADLRRAHSSPALRPSTTDADRPQSCKWKSALSEAQYLAGSLISHPSESTRHHSVIRHSHGLIWYRGPHTSISITILSDAPLPPHRSLYLQPKGYSGDLGMALQALNGPSSTWLDVTPERRATPDTLPAADERGIQRDLTRFSKNASGRQRTHVPRETHLVRIPATATDGYFRLVVCAGPAGTSVLCGSPVFRVASMSTDPSVMRGASASTLPLEVGVKMASTVGRAVVNKYTAIAQTALGQAGKTVEAEVRKRWKNETPTTLLPPEALPVSFSGTVTRGTGRSLVEQGIPTANLSNVPDRITAMRGVYAAWARIGLCSSNGWSEWHQSIVTIAPPHNAPPRVAVKSAVAVHILHDFQHSFFHATAEVRLMAYLHPAAGPGADPDHLVVELSRDVVTTLATLQEACPSPDSSQRPEAHGLMHIPLHWAGVRTESAALLDTTYGRGGICIPRDSG